MNFRALAAMAALVAVTLLGVACGSTPGPSGSSCTKNYKVGLVTDVGKLSDKSFNFDSFNGVLDAQADSTLCVKGKAIESSVESDYPKNIQTFLDASYDMIVTVGFKLGDATIKAAKANPNVKFAMVDFADFAELGKPAHPTNLVGLTFKLDNGFHDFAPLIVGHPDDRDVDHGGMLGQHPFHLDRVDVLAAGDDHVLQPVLDEDVAAVVDSADIAGAEPAVLCDRLGRRLGLVVVTLHQLL